MAKPEDAEVEILVVDDDLTIIQFMYKLLKSYGRVRFSETAADTYKILSDSIPDIIVLDINLPDGNGLKICRKLKSDVRTKNIPIIIVTGNDDLNSEEAVFDAGASDYVKKPVTPAVMKARAKIHIEYNRLLKKLDNESRHDPLTGLANRRQFDSLLMLELQRARREELATSLLMIDIDDFKSFNDQFGHPAGDECLVSVAKALNRAIYRPADLVARYGGEEFVVILPDTSEEGAKNIAERIRSFIAQLSITQADRAVNNIVSVSIGCATTYVNDNFLPDSAAKVLLTNADLALYSSKERGKDCVTSYQADN